MTPGAPVSFSFNLLPKASIPALGGLPKISISFQKLPFSSRIRDLSKGYGRKSAKKIVRGRRGAAIAPFGGERDRPLSVLVHDRLVLARPARVGPACLMRTK
jgi:hypothetical protein